MVSRRSKPALHSITERTSRLLRLSKLEQKTAAETNKAIIRALKRFPPEARRTLTLDNGTENAKHEELTAELGTKCYFAHPYAAWQRGSNEQINGLVRRYLPKGTDFSRIDKDQIKKIERLINNRPRKCLGLKHPWKLLAQSLHFTVECGLLKPCKGVKSTHVLYEPTTLPSKPNQSCTTVYYDDHQLFSCAPPRVQTSR